MENVAKIVIGTENGAWKEAKIIDKKGNVKVINNVNEIINILSKFAISENIQIEDLFKREDKIQKIDMKSKEYLEIKSGNIIIHENGKVEGKPQVEEMQEDKKNVEASKKEDSVLVEKEEKKGIKFRYIAVGALLVATLIGGTVLLQSPYSDENKAKNRKNNKVYSQTYDNEFSVTEHPGSANEVFNEKLDETYDNIDSYVTQVSRIEDKVYTEDEINALVNKHLVRWPRSLPAHSPGNAVRQATETRLSQYVEYKRFQECHIVTRVGCLFSLTIPILVIRQGQYEYGKVLPSFCPHP